MIFRCFFSYFLTYFLLINISINTDLYSDKFTLTVTKNKFWAHKINQCVLVVPVFTLRQISLFVFRTMKRCLRGQFVASANYFQPIIFLKYLFLCQKFDFYSCMTRISSADGQQGLYRPAFSAGRRSLL